jgi:catalase
MGQADFLAANNPPPSYANSAYYGIHTLKFLDQGNQTTFVKWRFDPEDGQKELTDDELKSMPADFLERL